MYGACVRRSSQSGTKRHDCVLAGRGLGMGGECDVSVLISFTGDCH